jgi:hypothetical protein
MTELPPLREVIARHGLQATKALGQNFLLDEQLLDRIAKLPGKLQGQQVLEIGPGPGGLTRALLRAGAQVTAIEMDRRCLPALAELDEAFPGQLRVIEGDATKVPHGIEGPFHIVANLPYNVGTALFVGWLGGAFFLLPPGVKQRLGIAAGLLDALEHEVAGRLEGRAGSSQRRGRPSARRADRRRSGHRPWPPCGAANPSPDRGCRPRGAASWPCAAKNAQGRAVFHQADVVDVGHLGAADALVDPAHDIAEQALRVVVQFLAHFGLPTS